MITVHLGKKELYFPEYEKVCYYCNYLRPDRIDGRYYCLITNELMFKVKEKIGQECPIDWSIDWQEGEEN